MDHGGDGVSTSMPSLGKRARAGSRDCRDWILGAVAAPLSCSAGTRISDRGVGDKWSAGRWDGELGWGVEMTERRHIGSAALLLCCPRCCPREPDRGAPHPARLTLASDSTAASKFHPASSASCWGPASPRISYLPGLHLMPGLPGLPACLFPHPCSTTPVSR